MVSPRSEWSDAGEQLKGGVRTLPFRFRTWFQASFSRGGCFQTIMFDKQSLDSLFDELRDQYELEPDWEEIQRDAHLGVARLDGGVEIGNLDPRVAELVVRHNPG